jgi:hypothetical protein
MPATITLDDSGRFQILHVTSPSSTAECQAAVADAIAAPSFLEHHALLIDRRTADLPSVAFIDEMVNFVWTYRDLLAGGRVAIVTSSDAAYGMSRMMELKSEAAVSIHAFKSYDEAVTWLSSEG